MIKFLNLIYTIIIITALNSCNNSNTPQEYFSTDTRPTISPDYTQITIPPNIAPLNFKIEKEAKKYSIEIRSKQSKLIIESNDGKIIFPMKKWKKLLSENKGDSLHYTIYLQKDDNTWEKYPSFFQAVSDDNIDSHLAYRLINTGYVLWEKLGIYQRNLESFNQDPVIENTSLKGACINCHSFSANNPNNMMLHVRKHHGGTAILHNGELKKIETKTAYTLSSGVYPSWHPDGNHIAFSVNKIGQQFHAKTEKRITVSDNASDIIIYDILKNRVTTNPQVSTVWRENLPTWSPCGKYLYYISAPQQTKNPIPIDAEEPYSLLRIAYDIETNTWGTADTLIKADEFKGSISFPKPSPCGNYLVFTRGDKGYFTIHDNNADLFLLNLNTGEISKPEINSSFTDSYHSWSKSGRWMVFSTKRPVGLFTRPHFTHFSEDGTFSKPFVLPQKDPEFYNSFLFNYNIPELITDRIKVTPIQLRNIITGEAVKTSFDPSVDVDALSGATSK